MFTRNWKKENSICERLSLPTKVWIHNAIELKLATYLEYILRIRVFHFHHLIGSYRLEWWKNFDFSLGIQWEVAWCCLTIFLKKNWKLIKKWKICKAGHSSSGVTPNQPGLYIFHFPISLQFFFRNKVRQATSDYLSLLAKKKKFNC